MLVSAIISTSYPRSAKLFANREITRSAPPEVSVEVTKVIFILYKFLTKKPLAEEGLYDAISHMHHISEFSCIPPNEQISSRHLEP